MFNDAALKRLNALCDLHGPVEECVELTPNEVLSLLDRLEAAEEVIRYAELYMRGGTAGGDVHWASYSDMYDIWKKAAGK